MRKILLAPVFLLAVLAARESGLFPVLPSNAKGGRQPGGFYLLPTSQLLRPWGGETPIVGRPVDLALDGANRRLAVLNTREIDLFDDSSGAALAVIHTRSTSYAGIAFRPASRELWASETGERDGLFIQSFSEDGAPSSAIRIAIGGHPVPCGIAFSPNGEIAYVALSRANAVAVIDANTKQLIRRIDVGMAPSGVAYDEHSGKVYVTNRGGRHPKPGDTLAPTSGAEVASDPVTGATSTGTVSVIDAETGRVSEFETGLAPSNIAVRPDLHLAAIVNSHSDSVSLFDTRTMRRADVPVPSWPKTVVGSQPDAVAFSADGKRMYVACGGTNAVVVMERSGDRWTPAGAIPVGYFPTAVAVDAAGGLRVLNLKGDGNSLRPQGNYNTHSFEGSLLTIPAPTREQLQAGEREVEAANNPRFDPAGGIANLPSLGIEHVFFIVKENRTYDQVFGDLPQGNGDPKLVMYGRNVSPNHHALAEKYVLLDNFYTSGAISFDGHQWLMMGFVSDYTERAFAASPRGYAWNMADALTVSPAGFFWQFAPKPISLRIYGEFCTPARWDPSRRSAVDITDTGEMSWNEYYRLYKEGKWPSAVGSKTGVPALAKDFDERYPDDSTAIPDQVRADEFLREFHEFEQNGKLTRLVVMTLNNDHTDGTRPGSPTPRAMVADDDLALGRIVEAISHSRYWAASLILVVEDDPQDGIDHVDGHRTVALAIGPHIRRQAVDSNHYTQLSLVRTVQDLFGIAPRTRFLVEARAMNSIFTREADNSTYEHLVPAIPLDEMNPPLKALKGRRLWAARRSLAMDFSEPDLNPPAVLDRILWWDAKGYDVPYPVKHEASLR